MSRAVRSGTQRHDVTEDSRAPPRSSRAAPASLPGPFLISVRSLDLDFDLIPAVTKVIVSILLYDYTEIAWSIVFH